MTKLECPSCLTAMTLVRGQQHYHCAPCNHFEFPNALENSSDPIAGLGKKTEFSCPRCEKNLEVGKLWQQVEVCFCPNCRGFVIDSESLGPLIQKLRAEYQGPDDQPMPVDVNALEQQEKCPACWGDLEAHPYYGPGNVVIDTCMHCKLVWFDQGELARIIRAPGLRK